MIERINGKAHPVKIELPQEKDYSGLTKAKYFFDWKTERENEVYKLCLEENAEIIGWVGLLEWPDKRIQICLIATSKTNRGPKSIMKELQET